MSCHLSFYCLEVEQISTNKKLPRGPRLRSLLSYGMKKFSTILSLTRLDLVLTSMKKFQVPPLKVVAAPWDRARSLSPPVFVLLCFFVCVTVSYLFHSTIISVDNRTGGWCCWSPVNVLTMVPLWCHICPLCHQYCMLYLFHVDLYSYCFCILYYATPTVPLLNPLLSSLFMWRRQDMSHISTRQTRKFLVLVIFYLTMLSSLMPLYLWSSQCPSTKPPVAEVGHGT